MRSKLTVVARLDMGRWTIRLELCLRRCYFGSRSCSLSILHHMAVEMYQGAIDTEYLVLTPSSDNIYIQSRQWCRNNNVREWLELSRSGLLHPFVLSTGVWLYSCEVRRTTTSHYTHTK
jgi:hypothetical protein